MGRPDTVMQSYLSEKPHFADLFNGVFFQGTPVISPCDLQEASERYSVPGGAGSNRFRDIKMILKTGETFRVLAVENQDNIDYTMPYRCMQYDVMEYGRQLKELLHALKYRNDKSGLLKLLEEDRRYSHLAPDTMEALSVLLDIPTFLEQKQTNEEKVDHNMCQAIMELRREEREAGRAEGLEKTKLIIIRNMLKRGFSDDDICALAECTVELIDSVR